MSKETELFVRRQKLTIEERASKNREDEEVKKRLKEQRKLIEGLENDIKNLKMERASIVSSTTMSPPYLHNDSSFENMSVADLNKQIDVLLQQIVQLQKELSGLDENEKK